MESSGWRSVAEGLVIAIKWVEGIIIGRYDLFETTLSEGVSPRPTGEAVTAADFDRASRDARDKAVEFYTNLVWS